MQSVEGPPDAVLVVEDDRVVADTLRLYFEHAGFRVLVAGDGRRGLELAQRGRRASAALDADRVRRRVEALGDDGERCRGGQLR